MSDSTPVPDRPLPDPVSENGMAEPREAAPGSGDEPGVGADPTPAGHGAAEPDEDQVEPQGSVASRDQGMPKP